jgi:dGTPase
VRRHHEAVLAEFPSLAGRRLLFEIIRRMLSEQVHDVIDATAAALREAAPADAWAARQRSGLIRFSEAMQADSAALKRFLMKALYRHPQVMRTTGAARLVVTELFAAYVASPSEMVDEFARREDRYRSVADYVAGMTDRFASREHLRLTGRDAFAQAAAGRAPSAPI